MGLAIDGLVTGMSTTDTVNQLMRVEALPQAALKTRVGVHNKVVTAYQSINSRLASVAVAARALGSPDTWGSMKTTSSSDAAVVSATAGAASGSLNFRVEKLAAAHTMTHTDRTTAVSSVSDAVTSPVMTGDTFDITLADGSSKTLTPTDKSLASVVAAINGTSDAAYTASAVQIEPGKYTLQLTAKETGLSTAFTSPTGIDKLGTAVATTVGSDAELLVGTDVTYSIKSASNTFADVLPGVTVTATRKQAVGDPPVTISLKSDAEGIAAKVQALVDNANVALTEIASQTRPKSGETAAGVLVGDSAMRKLSQDILGAVSAGANGLSLNDVGVGLDRSGKLTFDKTKFVDAYKADPVKTQAYFDAYTPVAHGKASATKFDAGWDIPQGLARRLENVSVLAGEGVILPTDSPDKAKQGLLSGLIQRRNESIKDLNEQVSAWDVRLERRKAGLQRQFSGLEVAMGKMQQQSSWLAGQLAGLS
jgi:flagellar hook-associated protein 2